MLGQAAKLILVFTSVAPVILTWAFADYLVRGPAWAQLLGVVATGALVLVATLILFEARRRLPRWTETATSVRPVDSEVVGFVIAYLFPLAFATFTDLEPALFVFVVGLVTFIVWTTNAFHFNPLMTLAGYHFYEIETGTGITYLLLSDADIKRTRDVNRVAQLTNYVLLDVTGKEKGLGQDG